MSSLSEKEIKQLNSITPIYSNQKDNSSIATDISPIGPAPVISKSSPIILKQFIE